ncbi:CBO0543 family protein [Clostridium sp. L74]|uniref:CBO0543 family protein n=1 Tax=Clostridium sp. L74 TaxID=1560217 RepID=UPI0006ABE78F|nr:CBO0543 family protein [Clostridium sp. L74]KOR27031.1 membrane protein [Clostridium sp. L74]
MLFNIIIAFIIPWISGIIFYFKDRKVLFTIAPFQSVIAYTVNSIGFFYNLWSVCPHEYGKFTTMPYDLGIYPILSVYLIHYIDKTKFNPYLLIMIATIFTTFLEWLGILSGKVVYSNGWNIGFTFISYLLPYLLNYWFYIQLKQMKIFD